MENQISEEKLELIQKVQQLMEDLNAQKFDHYVDAVEYERVQQPCPGCGLQRIGSFCNWCEGLGDVELKEVPIKKPVYFNDKEKQEQALQKLLSLDRDETFPIILEYSDKEGSPFEPCAGFEKHIKEITSNWEIDNRYLLSIATDPDNPERVRQNSLYAIRTLKCPDEELPQTYETLLSLLSESPYMVTWQSLSTINSMGPLPKGVEKKLRTWAGPWNFKIGSNLGFKIRDIIPTKSWVEILTPAAGFGIATYVVGSMIQAIGPETFYETFIDVSNKPKMYTMLAIMGLDLLYEGIKKAIGKRDLF